MRHLLFLMLLFLTSSSLYGQTTSKTDTIFDLSSHPELKAPQFPGGQNEIVKFISKNFKYPRLAKEARVGGIVEIKFIVDTIGNVTDIEVIKGVREDINNEAIRLISLLKGWTPGEDNGKKVRVHYKIPISFYPDEKWKEEFKRNQKLGQN
ncbi:energy transducer TonB [Solitalea longa]|nr:energy transducer TonB [Solitalea longa]